MFLFSRIQSGDSSPPFCNYGPYDMKNGRCPRPGYPNQNQNQYKNPNSNPNLSYYQPGHFQSKRLHGKS